MQGSGGESAGGQTVTTAGVSLGTPEYMSPEQLAGERLDARTDLYSLGLVLFNMLTANLPYPRVTSKETLVRRLTSKPQTLAEVVPGRAWPAALQSALDRALAPEPVDRFDERRRLRPRRGRRDRRDRDAARRDHGCLSRRVGRQRSGSRRPHRGVVRHVRCRRQRDADRCSSPADFLVLVAAGAGAFAAVRERRAATTRRATPVLRKLRPSPPRRQRRRSARQRSAGFHVRGATPRTKPSAHSVRAETGRRRQKQARAEFALPPAPLRAGRHRGAPWRFRLRESRRHHPRESRQGDRQSPSPDAPRDRRHRGARRNADHRPGSHSGSRRGHPGAFAARQAVHPTG